MAALHHAVLTFDEFSGCRRSEQTANGLRMEKRQLPTHLFLLDADEEESLTGSQACPGFAGSVPITGFQSVETLEALMSWSGGRKSVSHAASQS